MSLKEKAKTKLENKAKKIAFKLIKPFLPFIIIIGLLFFTICSIIDAIFVQEVQTDDASMSIEQLELKNKCIEKSEYLNICNNYKDTEKTEYLLDMNNKENDKLIQWSHLYALIAFNNMINNTKIDENLLNTVSKEFESTFKYETVTLHIEDQNENDTISVREETVFILVESDTIIRSLQI